MFLSVFRAENNVPNISFRLVKSVKVEQREAILSERKSDILIDLKFVLNSFKLKKLSRCYNHCLIWKEEQSV